MHIQVLGLIVYLNTGAPDQDTRLLCTVYPIPNADLEIPL